MFQFTHPGRGATTNIYLRRPSTKVSIHAPREGCDSCFAPVPHLGNNVSIHAPREGCDVVNLTTSLTRDMFQFTHPGRGATPEQLADATSNPCFNSRTPGGVRRLRVVEEECAVEFQFTHPGRGATVERHDLCSIRAGFNSRTPGGVRPPLSPIHCEG